MGSARKVELVLAKTDGEDLIVQPISLAQDLLPSASDMANASPVDSANASVATVAKIVQEVLLFVLMIALGEVIAVQRRNVCVIKASLGLLAKQWWSRSRRFTRTQLLTPRRKS
jgi:hypothetical protein